MSHVQVPETEPVRSFAVGSTPSTGPFNFDFPYFTAGQIFVSNNGVPVPSSEYALVGDDDSGALTTGFKGGTVTLNAAVSDTTIVVFRDVPVARETDFPNSGPLNRVALNTQLDSIIMMLQEQDALEDLKLRFPEEELGLSDGLMPGTPASRANLFLAFDSDGRTIIAQEGTGSTPLTPWGQNWILLNDSGEGRDELGLSPLATAAGVDGNDWLPGGTDLAVEDGGTGASTPADARTNIDAAALSESQTFSKGQAGRIQPLTDAPTIAWDMREGNNAEVTLTTADRTLGNPTNARAGQIGTLTVRGAFTLNAFGSYWHFAGGTPPVGTTGKDIYAYKVETATNITIGLREANVS